MSGDGTMIPAADTSELDRELAPLVQRAHALVVDSPDTHERAQKELRGVARLEKWIADVYRTPKAILNKAHKDMVADEKKRLEPVRVFRVLVEAKIGIYEDDQRRMAEAERKRLEAEAKKAEEERALQAAVDAEASGDKALADEILAAPVEPAPVVLPPAITRVEGVSSRLLYSAEVTDLLALCKHIVTHPEDVNLICVNQSAINDRARSQRDGFRLAGCRLVKKQSMAVRA